MKKLLLPRRQPGWPGMYTLMARVMRLTLFLLFTCILKLSATGYSQEVKLSLSMKEVKLSRIFALIQQKSDYQFLYNDEDVRNAPPITISVHDATIPQILKTCLKDYPLGYSIENNTVVIAPLAPAREMTAPAFVVKGRVTDEKGAGLPGVAVLLKGTQTGTLTDGNGNFSLSLKDGSGTLLIKLIGYTPQEIAVAGRQNIEVQLVPEPQSLNSVVVVGYGTQRIKEVSGAIASVSSRDFNKGVVTNPMQQVQGKVAGLVITLPGGDPNQAAVIRLRGQTSLLGKQDPLIVVDGVQLDDPARINNIPPGDIASYDVLKDASATAIYGARGANGVIIINTKKGQAGMMAVDYAGYVGADRISKQYNMLSADEWKTAMTNLGSSPDAIAGYLKGGNTNWTDALTRTGVVQSHTLGVSGGTPHFVYRASANYLDQQGIVINTGQQIAGLRFNAQQKALQDRLDIQVGVVLSKTVRKYADYNIFQYALNSPPTYPVYNADGSFFHYSDFALQNPVEMQTEQENGGVEHFSQMFGTVNYELLKGLKVGVTGSLTHFGLDSNYFQPTFPLVNNLNMAKKTDNNRDSKRGDVHINYNHTWNEKHNFGFTGVYEYNEFTNSNFSAQGGNFLVEDFQDNNLNASDPARIIINSYKENYKLISFMGRVNYNYREKYYFEASVRRDGSSKFGANQRWGTFPAVSGAWRIGQEPFLQHVSWLSELKLRAGYGIVGNSDAISPYNSQLLVGTVGRYYDGATNSYHQAYIPTQNANPDLRWEERHGMNLGLNFGLLDNRITGDFNVFNDKTKHLLYNYTVPVPPFYVNNILANVGNLSNKGVELALSADIIKGKRFSWRAQGQIAFLKTRVTSLSGTYQGYKVVTDNIVGGSAQGRGLSTTPITYLKVGYAPYTFYLPHFAGVDKDGHQLFDSAGVAISTAQNAPKHYINPVPDFNYGFGSTLSLDNWSLNFFFRGVHGQKNFNNTLMILDNVNRLPGNNVTREALTNGIKDAPVASDRWLENASFLRLDNATLTYTFKEIKGLQHLSLYLSGNNLFVITKYRGLDPEILNGNDVFNHLEYIDVEYNGHGYYPKTRSFSFGVNVSF
ncbi:SusC/RagA family TonB-linked outer membrane protein [Chitinophaga parva]|uniref:SusC/RagA family TonB-linked outer membrane protein n=1 Tax=Chitinophaga parva TaxID=2169414 RepID=A0A2T7BF21_9BACT|nr:TonB-dependent receptor [Chitinophaga parva]PUZ24892.1 SusC/RagA family TonB-linked outer membrane protein [Chitinophaga parva]